ncbi:hypothetical protein ABH979_006233 [Bradyrhizobium ottawaense]
MITHDSDGACGDRGIDEARAVGLAAGECEEEIARLDDAAVEREPGHLERGDSGLDRGIA